MLASQSRFDADKLTFAKIIQAAMQQSGISITSTVPQLEVKKSNTTDHTTTAANMPEAADRYYHQLYLPPEVLSRLRNTVL